MTRWLWVLALPYVVTVTDMGKICNKFADGKPWYDDTCIGWGNYKRYHLPGFQDCVSSSTAQCSYLQEIADDLNRAHQAGYNNIDLNYAEHHDKIVCHKLVGGMMYSMPCEDSK